MIQIGYETCVPEWAPSKAELNVGTIQIDERQRQLVSQEVGFVQQRHFPTLPSTSELL
jgi:hypothetical protein